jgi:hypothetical protein
MGKPRVAPRDEFRLHPVSIALSKARAAAALADVCGRSDYLQLPRTDDDADTRGWIQDIAFDAIRAALTEADAAFRKSLTAERAKALGVKVSALAD